MSLIAAVTLIAADAGQAPRPAREGKPALFLLPSGEAVIGYRPRERGSR